MLGNFMASAMIWAPSISLPAIALQRGRSIYCLKNFSDVNLFCKISFVPITNNQITKHFHLVLWSPSFSINAFLFWLFSAQRSCCSELSFWESKNCLIILLTFFCNDPKLITGCVVPPPVSKSKTWAGFIESIISSHYTSSTKYFLRQLGAVLFPVS